jgi:hypothetical protein
MEYRHLLGGLFMCDFENKDILIYRTESVYVELIDNRFEGDLNRVIWSELDKIAFALVNIINNAGAKAEAVSYFSITEKNTVCVGKRITTISADNNIDVELLAVTFLHAITKGDNLSGELYDQHASPFDEIIKKESRDFLSQHSNKPIKQSLEISTGNSKLNMMGKYAQLTDREHHFDDPPEVHIAVVDGLVKHHRAVHLKLASQKIVVAYYDHRNFADLHSLMLTEETQQFTIQNKCDANGKKDLCLISIEKDNQEFFNVLS